MRTRRHAVVLVALAILVFGLGPLAAEAQHRGGSHGGGHYPAARPPVAGSSHHGYPHGGYYPYRNGWGYGWGFGLGFYYPYFTAYPWYPYGYFGYPAPWGYGDVYLNMGSVRLQVTPRDTEVYVDGYIVGVVDDFDGKFQRMRLPVGEHEIVLYREGHRRVSQKLYLTPGGDFRIKHVMEPLASGEPDDPRPVAPPPPAPKLPSEARSPRMTEIESVEAQALGTLAVRVQPPGAAVFIDGERWQGPEGYGPLEVRVAAGAHRIEVRKDGYVTFATDVTVQPGETETLNVSLPPERE